ncbi:collagen alpha-1(I) chain-like isoform X2 [Lemur catta]|uniref:collagen alpha-1(I) chain-like isoform X2 n=1 Tax=Lemur catta TaxID=9447 RepID=UPI001E26AAB5|nr:collagen alpha-1(I) chain-like isoform X2 [Lemur catta]
MSDLRSPLGGEAPAHRRDDSASQRTPDDPDPPGEARGEAGAAAGAGRRGGWVASDTTPPRLRPRRRHKGRQGSKAHQRPRGRRGGAQASRRGRGRWGEETPRPSPDPEGRAARGAPRGTRERGGREEGPAGGPLFPLCLPMRLDPPSPKTALLSQAPRRLLGRAGMAETRHHPNLAPRPGSGHAAWRWAAATPGTGARRRTTQQHAVGHGRDTHPRGAAPKGQHGDAGEKGKKRRGWGEGELGLTAGRRWRAANDGDPDATPSRTQTLSPTPGAHRPRRADRRDWRRNPVGPSRANPERGEGLATRGRRHVPRGWHRGGHGRNLGVRKSSWSLSLVVSAVRPHHAPHPTRQGPAFVGGSGGRRGATAKHQPSDPPLRVLGGLMGEGHRGGRPSWHDTFPPQRRRELPQAGQPRQDQTPKATTRTDDRRPPGAGWGAEHVPGWRRETTGCGGTRVARSPRPRRGELRQTPQRWDRRASPRIPRDKPGKLKLH